MEDAPAERGLGLATQGKYYVRELGETHPSPFGSGTRSATDG